MDKRVPLGIILAILIQTFALGAFITRMEGRITQLEIDDARTKIERAARRKATDDKFDFLFKERERMTKLETQMDFVFQTVKRIEQKLDGPTR